jgi:excisionase family DNA binding protein
MEARRYPQLAISLRRGPAEPYLEVKPPGVPECELVEVSSGAHSAQWNVAGRTVGYVRENLRLAYGIHPKAIPIVGGHEVEEDYVLQPSDAVEFSYLSGEKGAGDHIWTEEQFCAFAQISRQQLQELIAKGLKVIRLDDGSIRITETSVDEFNRGPVIDSPYLTADEAADYLKITKLALYGWVERKKLRPLPGYREYRFTREQLDAAIRGEKP